MDDVGAFFSGMLLGFIVALGVSFFIWAAFDVEPRKQVLRDCARAADVYQCEYTPVPKQVKE